MLFILFLFNAVVRGRVYDKNTYEPIAYVNIYTEDRKEGTTSDEGGYYQLMLSPGEYRIYFSMLGYETVIKRIKIKEEEEIKVVDVEMKIEPVRLKEIIVTAQRKEFKEEPRIHSAIVYSRELKTLPSLLEEDALRSLEILPGVTKPSDFSTGLFIRGAGCDANLVLLDGVELFNPQHLGGIVSTFDADMVKKAELILSGIPASYDGRLSAIIDIKTKPGNRIKPRFCISLSLLSAKISGNGPLFDNTNYAFSLRRTYYDKVIPIFTDEFVFPYYFYDAYLRFGKDFKNAHLFFSGFYNQDKVFYVDEEFNIDVSWSNRAVALNYFRKIDEKSIFSLIIGNTWFYLNQNVADSFLLWNNRIIEPMFKAELSTNWGKQRIKIGGETKIENIYYLFSVQEGFKYLMDVTTYPFGAYLQDAIRINHRFLFTPGIRLNLFLTYAKDTSKKVLYFKPAPRISLKYFLNEVTGIIFSLGKFHQFTVAAVSEEDYLAPFLMNWLPAAGKYNPPEAWHYNLGIEGWLGEGMDYFVELYYRRYKDLLILQESSKIDLDNLLNTIFKSPGTGNAYGVDVMFKKITGILTGWVSYSLLFSEVNFEGITYPPSWDRRHNLHLVILLDIGKIARTGLQTSFSTGNPYTPIIARWRNWYYHHFKDTLGFRWRDKKGEKNRARYPSYFRIDWSISKEFKIFGKNAEVKLNIINIINHRNVFIYYYDYTKEPPVLRDFPMLPIIPSLGFKLKI